MPAWLFTKKRKTLERLDADDQVKTGRHRLAVTKYRELASLHENRLHLLEKIAMCHEALKEYDMAATVLKEAVAKTKASISSGQTIAGPLRESEVFPPMVVQMISVGEETGALDEMLSKVADFYDEEVDSAVDALTSVIEPIMIVLMGGVVGGMVVAMYLPIFKLVSVIMDK